MFELKFFKIFMTCLVIKNKKKKKACKIKIHPINMRSLGAHFQMVSIQCTNFQKKTYINFLDHVLTKSCSGTRDRQTDGQTDRQTDRRTGETNINFVCRGYHYKIFL